jgi:uncharacterized protein YpmS
MKPLDMYQAFEMNHAQRRLTGLAGFAFTLLGVLMLTLSPVFAASTEISPGAAPSPEAQSNVESAKENYEQTQESTKEEMNEAAESAQEKVEQAQEDVDEAQKEAAESTESNEAEVNTTSS